MGLTVHIEDETSIRLDNIDVTVSGDSIEFSIAGEITDIPPELLAEYSGENLSPVEITFTTD